MVLKRKGTTGLRQGIAALILLSGIALTFQSCYETGGAGGGRPSATIPAVEALQARLGSLPLVERLTGVVRAQNQVAIHSEVNAVITEVLVKNGQLVQKEQPLVRLRDTEFRERLKQLQAGYQITVAQAKQAEAQLQEALAEQRRAESMAEQRLISDSVLEAARTKAVSGEASLELANARVQQAAANLDEQQEILSQTVIRAPVTGTVGDRNAEVGMLVNSGTQLFTLGQLGTVRVEVVLTDRMLEYIKLGQRAEIFTDDGSERRMQASLSRISPFLNPVAHTTVGEIDAANPEGRLRPGMFVGVDIHYGESEKATLVPLSTLYEDPTTGKTGVYVTEASLERDPVPQSEGVTEQAFSDPVSFEFVPVQVIAKGRMHAGIVGIEPGQWIISLGQDLLGGKSGQARVRTVDWDWVEQMQQMQRQDLLQEIMRQQQKQQENAG